MAHRRTTHQRMAHRRSHRVAELPLRRQAKFLSCRTSSSKLKGFESERNGPARPDVIGGGEHKALFTTFLCSLFLGFVGTPLYAVERAIERPNILLILPDQMRASAMGCDGNDQVKTPHIDRLAAQGIRFRNTYANVPVCCSARAVLLTGTHAHVNGMLANDLRLREEQVTLAELLSAHGYRTGFVGKWHLDGGPRLPGFVPPGPRRQGFEFWAAYECHHQHFNPTYFRDTPDVININKFEPEASCDFALEFLRTQPRDRPFFLTVQMGPPHNPYGAPEKYMQQYPPERVVPPRNWQPGSGQSPTKNTAKNATKNAASKSAGAVLNRGVSPGGLEEIAAYYAAVTAIDDQLGRLMQTLQELKLDQNTIVLFTSDHGDMLGSHGLRLKRKPYDESARVPGIIRWPERIPSGQVAATLLSHVDMAPTLLGLAGLDVPKNLQGINLANVALGRSTQGPDAVLLQQFVPFRPDNVLAPWRGLITQRYTYARFEDSPWLLFDRQTDPDEMQNLIDDAESAELRNQLDEQLTALMKKNGDAWNFNTSESVEEGGGLYSKQTFYSLDDYLEWKKSQPVPEKR